jgi:hypothetical protein
MLSRLIPSCRSRGLRHDTRRLRGVVPDNRIVRWTVNATFTGMPARQDIVTGIPLNTLNGNHSGCRLRFGPDGYLWSARATPSRAPSLSRRLRSAARCSG